MRNANRLITLVLAGMATLALNPRVFGQNVSVDPSGRYYRNAAGQPVFLIGYYDWAAVPDGYFIDLPSRYADMIVQDAPYKINYIRISLGVARFTNPPDGSGNPTPVPFAYSGNPAKANLNQWDNIFWTGLRNQCSLAQTNNVIINIAFFDGVEIRSQGGADYGYSNSFWNPAKQTATFYSNPDFNSNGQIDDSGEFYQTTNFNNDTGIGHYQRLVIAKTISETASFNNVMFEVGNELLASDSTWNTAVINYAKSLTSKPVTQNQGGAASNKNGWSQHIADTPAQVKSNVASIVGQGYPAWEDPDGPALSDDNVSSDDLRRAAWYSFAGGAAAWGGFTTDFWNQTFNSTKTNYYKYLQNFITLGGVQFSQMTPQHNLVSSNSVNSCLAKTGTEYVAYILNGASATLTLTGISGQIRARMFDCKLGQYTAEQTLQGGSSPTFNKPAGADDWAIHVRAASDPTIDLGATTVPDGIMNPQVGDGNTSAASIGGRDARQNTNPATDNYFYFAVDDGWAFQGSKTSITFTVNYYDSGTGSLILAYDATSAAYKDASPTITLTNTNTWKQAVISVSDAYFGNRENNGSDFRIWVGNTTRYIDVVNVSVVQSPFGGSARAIPSIVQAEDFDNGGEGAAYHDVDTPNQGGQYRPNEGVDIEPCTDTGGGFNVGWADPSEWMEYTVNVNQTGDYAIKMRMAANGGGGSFHLLLDGVNLTSLKSVTSTGGNQNWTTIIIPGVFMTSGNNKILRFFNDTGGFNINYMDFAFGGADVVSEDLSASNIDDGMTHPQGGDGDSVAATIGGHDCRKNVNAADDFYMYFTVIDNYAFQGNKNNATITFDYYDTGTGSFALQYDGTGNAYTNGPSVTLTNTNTWKIGVFNVTDAYFGNRQNNGSDFRIFRGAGITFYIDTVMVFAQAGAAPPGQAGNPNPANAATGVNITSTLSWTAGSGATSHDVRFGTVNPPPFIINQAGTTYNPGTMAVNTTYFWRIDEKNAVGTTTGTVWSFTTLPLPGAASAPNPANGATGVSTTPTLSWTAGSNATSHDVRFGTANPPPFIQNQAGTTYAPSTLSNTTTYFWRIDEKNSSGTTTGTVWSFTTAASTPAYFTNSSFENGFTAAGGGYNGSVGTGWTPYIYTGVPSDMTFSDETGAGNFDSGAHSQKTQAGAGKEGGVYNRFSVVNGQNYTVTVRAKSGSPAAQCWFGINTSGGTDAHESSGTIYPAENGRSTSWQTFSWTGTATGNFITLFLDTYDGVGYWDTATPASPGSGPVTISNSTFASSADGWNIVVWHIGPNLDGTMAFEGGTGNPAGDMLSGASGGTNSTDSCTREGGEINKTISTAGYNTLVQVQYDLRFNTDQSGTACIGNCTPLEGNCADKIAVYYSTAGTGGPWTLLEAVNALSLTQNVWSTRTINCPAAANNKANFALRFRFQFNTAPVDSGRLDNIKVIATP